MCTDHIDISSLRGLLLRELLNCLVLLVVTHTGYKNLFFFLLSYMYGEEYFWNRFLNPLKPGVWERLVVPSMKEWFRTPSCYLEVGPL